MVNPLVFVPLYIYPSSDAWSSLFTSVSANPSLNFAVVVNPDSGPGSSTYPDSNWISAVSELNGYSNVQTLGYVHTSYATRTYSDATADIDVFAGWANYADADIHMDGIFFDESPSDTTSSEVAYMSNITTYARSSIGSDAYLTLNTGVPVSDEYYDIADMIIAFENYYSSYSSSSISDVSTSQRSKSTFLIHDYTSTASAQTSIINQLLTADIPGIFITTESDYNSFSSMWSSYISGIASDGTSSSSSSTSSSSTKTSSSSTSTKASSTSTTKTTSTTPTTTSTTKTSSTKTTATTPTATSVQLGNIGVYQPLNGGQLQGGSTGGNGGKGGGGGGGGGGH